MVNALYVSEAFQNSRPIEPEILSKPRNAQVCRMGINPTRFHLKPLGDFLDGQEFVIDCVHVLSPQ